VIFVTTANTLETIPGPLRDRMEVIQLAGYTASEKLEIAKRYLVKRQIERGGLSSRRIAFTDAALKTIIADYTREAGVRQLEREIGTVVRRVALQVAEGKLDRKLSITEPRVRELLGKRKFFAEARRRTSRPGVATGLAWTPVGGDRLCGTEEDVKIHKYLKSLMKALEPIKIHQDWSAYRSFDPISSI